MNKITVNLRLISDRVRKFKSMRYEQLLFRMVIEFNETVTNYWVDYTLNTLKQYDDRFKAARQIARYLGGHVVDNIVVLGFWTPQLLMDEIDPDSIAIEIFTAEDPVDLQQPQQTARFNRVSFPGILADEFLWLAVSGMTAGTKNKIGSFYRGIYRKHDGSLHFFHDCLAYSMPFGMFAPVEMYDFNYFNSIRSDRLSFINTQNLTTRNNRTQFTKPVNILEIHIGTASKEGTIAGLNRIYKEIGRKLRSGETLLPFEQNYVGYDAIQFMPIEPIKELRNATFFDIDQENISGTVNVTLNKPDITNWGYDINIHGSSAINPVLLESGRPDELAEFLHTLHTFPDGPIMAIWDLVFGHATNQGLEVLPPEFFSGSNMYGQNMNFLHPVVRAILLEMQRRKTNWGATGLRVDGAQDFVNWDPDLQIMHHEDEYLQEMSDVVAKIGDTEYYPWMIFEDGRPWPQSDWELSSSYRSVIDLQPNTWQWGPLTFAHNTPFIFTFWLSKLWRVREIMEVGSHWISGCSNHDTLRRGAQVNPWYNINNRLGPSPREIIKHAYNNEAQQLFFYIMAPGVPMDFLNANMQSPWLYFRNNDEHYGIKVVSEEFRFLDWWITPDIYHNYNGFNRLKEWGFQDYKQLYKFMKDLVDAINLTNYDVEEMAVFLRDHHRFLEERLFSSDGLKAFGHDFMDDMYEYVKLDQYFNQQNEVSTEFNFQIRQYRRQHPWLGCDLDVERGEYFDYLHPSQGRAIYFGRRVTPETLETRFELCFIGNMEGKQLQFIPQELPIPNLVNNGWELLFKAPSLDKVEFNQEIILKNSETVVFVRYL